MSRNALRHVSETSGLDGQLLLSQAMERTRAWILAHPEDPLDKKQGQHFMRMLDRCLSGEPLPYVLGWWEFYGRRFRLDHSVLIPRPETELLIEAALEFLRQRSSTSWVVEVGTGSGCVAVTLAKEVPGLRLFATDLSFAALRLAHENAFVHEVDGAVHLICADLLPPVSETLRFDLICANLPYIPSNELGRLRVAEREPNMALDGGADGLVVIRRLLDLLPSALSPTGRALFEIGAGQATAVMDHLASLLPDAYSEVRVDLADRHRLVIVDRIRGTV